MAGKIRGIRGLIYSKYDTEAEFAGVLGWTKQRLNKITNGAKVPDLYEVKELANGLGESLETVAGFFIPKQSPNGQHDDQQAI